MLWHIIASKSGLENLAGSKYPSESSIPTNLNHQKRAMRREEAVSIQGFTNSKKTCKESINHQNYQIHSLIT